MIRRPFRCLTRKQPRGSTEVNSRQMKRSVAKENHRDYDGLSYCEIQSITREMMRDPKAHEHNMGVLSTIKGKMYCLKLGTVSKSKNVEHFFYSNQFKRRQNKPKPLERLSDNEAFSVTIERC